MGKKIDYHLGHTESNPLNSRVKKNKHHTYPKHPDKKARVIVVDERHHSAYHLLFGNPRSYEMACFILARDWFPDDFERLFSGKNML